MPLVHGDTFLFFTDGISEAMNAEARNSSARAGSRDS